MSWRARDFCAEIAKAACAAGLTIGSGYAAAAMSVLFSFTSSGRRKASTRPPGGPPRTR